MFFEENVRVIVTVLLVRTALKFECMCNRADVR